MFFLGCLSCSLFLFVCLLFPSSFVGYGSDCCVQSCHRDWIRSERISSREINNNCSATWEIWGACRLPTSRLAHEEKVHTKKQSQPLFCRNQCGFHQTLQSCIISHGPKSFVGVKSAAVVFTAPVIVVSLELASDCLNQVVEFRVDRDAAFGVLLHNHLS